MEIPKFKITDFKIGDYVYKYDIEGIKNDVVARIISMSEGFEHFGCQLFYNGTIDTGGLELSKVCPIPITRKLLVDNGWLSDSFDYPYNGILFVTPDRNFGLAYGKDGCFYNGAQQICWLHELQHLLWVKGLNDRFKTLEE